MATSQQWQWPDTKTAYSIVTIFSFGFLSDEFYASHAYETN